MQGVRQKVWLLVLACSVMLLPLRAYATTLQPVFPQPPSVGMGAEVMHHAVHEGVDAQAPAASQHCDSAAKCSDGCMHCLVCPHGVAAALPVPAHTFPLARHVGIKPAEHGRLISTTLSPAFRPPILS